jgi:hypothetical protein
MKRTILQLTTLCGIPLHYTILHFTTLHNTIFATISHYTTLLDHTTPHNTTLHYITPHATILHNKNRSDRPSEGHISIEHVSISSNWGIQAKTKVYCVIETMSYRGFMIHHMLSDVMIGELCDCKCMCMCTCVYVYVIACVRVCA